MNTTHHFVQLTNKEEYLLRQLASTLKAQFDQLQIENAQEIEQLLTQDISWQNLYRAESLMIPHLPEAELNVRWQRVLVDKSTLNSELNQYYAQADESLNALNKEESTQQKRALLGNLLNDLNWVRERKRVKRLYENRIQRNVILTFLFSFLVFFSPTAGRLLFNLEFDNLRLYYIFTAASSGFLGASFSQLIGLKNSLATAPLEQVKAMSNIANTLARTMIGAGAGLIMFYLLQSGLMEGVLFPAFIQSTEQLQQVLADNNNSNMVTSTKIEQDFQLGSLAKPAQGLSLLIVWCILSGFSEKLIPNLLEKTQGRLGKTTTASKEKS